MQELDLHGHSHYEVESIVENFVLLNQPPTRIITGNSNRMRNIVMQILDEHNIKYYVPFHNQGEIIITSW